MSNYHQKGEKPDIYLFSTPRSGSTWLMELITSQKGIKFCNEPFNIRHADIRRELNISDWPDFYEEDALQMVEAYFSSLSADGFHNNIRGPHLLDPHYEWTTNRIVFKILHAGEHEIEWFRQHFRGQIVYLLRHPIPVSLSRDDLPRLDSFLKTSFRENFSQEQLKYADRVHRKGNHLEKNMLDWCLQNSLPLKRSADKMNIVTYEQLVIQPEPVVSYLAEALQLDDPDTIMHQLSSSSRSTKKSTKENQQTLKKLQSHDDRSLIIKKWKNKISDSGEEHLMEALAHFEIDVYQTGKILPKKEVWIGDGYEEVDLDGNAEST